MNAQHTLEFDIVPILYNQHILRVYLTIQQELVSCCKLVINNSSCEKGSKKL